MTNPATKILVADDEPDMVWALEHSLRDEGYQVLTAYNGAEALDSAQEHHPDLVILDISMPLLTGLEVCHELRRHASLSAVPILFLTVRRSIEDRVEGLDLGGDDYITKPFELRELKARVRALLRRARTSRKVPEQEEHSASPSVLEIDISTHQVRVRNQVIQLTPTEFDLLHFLMTRERQVFSAQQLAQEALGYSAAADNTSLVRWHIRNLRQKIELDPQHPAYILTIPHHGYILASDIAPA